MYHVKIQAQKACRTLLGSRLTLKRFVGSRQAEPDLQGTTLVDSSSAAEMSGWGHGAPSGCHFRRLSLTRALGRAGV